MANQDGGSISVINTETHEVTATVPVEGSPTDLAVGTTEAGVFVYVVRRAAGSVAVIDTVSNSVVDSIPVGAAPAGIAISPDGASAYVANSGADTVSVIDIATGDETVIDVGAGPEGIAVGDDGKFAYVANREEEVELKRFAIIDTATNTVVDTVGVGSEPAGLAVYSDGLVLVTGTPLAAVAIDPASGDGRLAGSAGLPSGILRTLGVAITPDDTQAFVCAEEDGPAGTVIIVERRDNPNPSFIFQSSIALGGAAQPVDVAVTPDGAQAFVTDKPADEVAVIDIDSGEVTRIAVGSAPHGIAIAAVPGGCPGTATPTPTVIPSDCAGDCDGNDSVSISELLRGVRIALGFNDVPSCPAFDTNGNDDVSISELVAAVRSALNGC